MAKGLMTYVTVMIIIIIIIIIKEMRSTWCKCKSTARPRYNRRG